MKFRKLTIENYKSFQFATEIVFALAQIERQNVAPPMHFNPGGGDIDNSPSSNHNFSTSSRRWRSLPEVIEF